MVRGHIDEIIPHVQTADGRPLSPDSITDGVYGILQRYNYCCCRYVLYCGIVLMRLLTIVIRHSFVDWLFIVSGVHGRSHIHYRQRNDSQNHSSLMSDLITALLHLANGMSHLINY